MCDCETCAGRHEHEQYQCGIINLKWDENTHDVIMWASVKSFLLANWYSRLEVSQWIYRVTSSTNNVCLYDALVKYDVIEVLLWTTSRLIHTDTSSLRLVLCNGSRRRRRYNQKCFFFCFNSQETKMIFGGFLKKLKQEAKYCLTDVFLLLWVPHWISYSQKITCNNILVVVSWKR